MTIARVGVPVFLEGEEVVLAEGTYQGTVGVFLRLREDVKWADITEDNRIVRSHPVAWLAHFTGANQKQQGGDTTTTSYLSSASSMPLTGPPR